MTDQITIPKRAFKHRVSLQALLEIFAMLPEAMELACDHDKLILLDKQGIQRGHITMEERPRMEFNLIF